MLFRWFIPTVDGNSHQLRSRLYTRWYVLDLTWMLCVDQPGGSVRRHREAVDSSVSNVDGHRTIVYTENPGIELQHTVS